MSTGARFFIIFLAIEFLDEFVYGSREAAWPLLRSDLLLTYAQIGVLLGVPRIVSGLTEPILGILGDVWRRRALILGGGLIFALALLLTSISRSYGWLLLSFAMLSPASGAFVSLSQASLMDADPRQREKNMARWTFAGSLGVVLGPLALGGLAALNLGWRAMFAATFAIAIMILGLAWRSRLATTPRLEGVAADADPQPNLIEGLRAVPLALRRGEVLRWLVLLQFSDLMLDVLLGFLALYFVDVSGTSATQASMAVAVWTGVGLLGDLLLIRLLDHVDGIRYLRLSAVVELLLFIAFLELQSFGAKLGVLAFLGLFNAGWYSILQARLYATMPGRSGTVLAVNNLFGLVGGLVPWTLGIVAQRVDLQAAMWLLCLGPVALLVGLPVDFAKVPRPLQS